jgi:hypothetical protein
VLREVLDARTNVAGARFGDSANALGIEPIELVDNVAIAGQWREDVEARGARR